MGPRDKCRNMISSNKEDRHILDIEMFRVPPVSIDELPEVLLCKFKLSALMKKAMQTYVFYKCSIKDDQLRG